MAVHAQCPENIGFEDGTFDKWECYTGTVLGGPLVIRKVDPELAAMGILENSSPQVKDIFGNFPVNCPNGSGYSIVLGNAAANAKANRVTYTFTIPPDKLDYSIVYYYAIVFQNPAHTPDQQPKFTATVYNLTDNEPAGCGSLQFVSSAGLDGFFKSNLNQGGNRAVDVYYKPWSPVTINLAGYQGKKIMIEFTATDCTPKGHFCYAYVDIDENCTPTSTGSPIKGNSYCRGAASVNLSAPAGFEEYQWYKGDDHSKVLGTESTLTLLNPPAEGTVYSVHVKPVPGLGCEATFYTTIHAIDEPYTFKVKPEVFGCTATGYDLTQASVKAGSSSNLKYEYFTNPGGTEFLSDPKAVLTSGTYYIRGTNGSGCTDVQPVKVTLYPSPTLVLQGTPLVCSPATVDLTSQQWIANYDEKLTYTYWQDGLATQPLTNPKKISVSGLYYIKVANSTGCFDIKPINVTVGAIPKVVTHDVLSCPPANLKAAAVTAGSDPGLEYSYFTDAAGTKPLTDPDKITVSGTYYVQGTSSVGCGSALMPVKVTINPVPVLNITDPEPVIYPTLADLSRTFQHVVGVNYTYWKDAAATVALEDYTGVKESGRYYIKAQNQSGCFAIMPVNASIYPPAVPVISGPNTFSPNGDGVNDLFKLEIVGINTATKFTIFNRWGQAIYEVNNGVPQWDGTYKGQVQALGTYYWLITYRDTYRNKEITKSGSITIVK
ncbi:T9SS type B sorting domain-containing protein [Mucilaginibacter koreensis]